MLKGLSNLGSLMKQASQLGNKVGEINEQLKLKRATGSAGGGMVEVEVNGLGEVLRLTIEPKLIKENETEMIEDLVPAAVNQAIQKSKELYAEAMKSTINLPGMDEAIDKLTGGLIDKD